MKKQVKKLQISRETLQRLDDRKLVRVDGGIDWTGCMSECTECGAGPYLAANQ